MSEGKTPRTLDQALASWPEPERKDVEWTPEKAPSAPFADVSDEELLGPPLRAGAAEGTAPSGPASSRGKDRAKQQQQLQELAKLAEMKLQPEPAKEKEESSGVVHLAALAASEGQNVDGTPLAAPPATVPAAPEERRAEALPSPGEKGVGRPSWLVVGGLVAAAAAIALVFGMKHPGSEGPPVQVTIVAPAPAAPAPTTTATASPTESKEALDKAVDPSTLPPAEALTGGHPASPAAAPAALAKPAAVAAASAAPQPAAVGQVAPAAPANSASLETLMQQAAGTPSTAATATGNATESPAAAPTSVVLKPSQGAIQGALGAALPGARACLGPDDPISRATVTFQSDGTVQSVSVTGGAAGKPAEACIRSALMRAKVPPFAVPTFTAPATIRSE